jgi:hypothetical protein
MLRGVGPLVEVRLHDVPAARILGWQYLIRQNLPGRYPGVTDWRDRTAEQRA